MWSNSNKVKSTCRARAPTCRRQRSRVCSWWCTRCACHKAHISIFVYRKRSDHRWRVHQTLVCVLESYGALNVLLLGIIRFPRTWATGLRGGNVYSQKSSRCRERRHWTAWFCHARAPRRLTNWRLRLPDRGPLACNSHATPLWRTGAFTSSAAAQLQTSHSHPAVSQGLLATRHTLD